MDDNIILKKIWEDGDIIELKAICSSSIVTIESQIYVSALLIDELIYQIKEFLYGNIDEGSWENEERGDSSTTCLSFRFINKDRLGHIHIEVYAELDDGGSYDKHNCCFFVNTEYGLLMDFCDSLIRLKNGSVGCEISLNHNDN